ncbi:MAG: hypothetical protein Q8N63_02075 [Nanoarchaeota archaeon]|nr:hypothetical protein [Nanoarchaeota archaeon]
MAKFFVDDSQDLTLILDKKELGDAKKNHGSLDQYAAESEKDVAAFYSVNSRDKRFKKVQELSLGNKLIIEESQGRIVYHINISIQACERLEIGEECSERYPGGSKLFIKLKEF